MSPSAKRPALTGAQKLSYQFIFIMGMVSLFGDVTYEGARSITGPYLAVLGGSAAIVGIVSGLGEFIGYALRLVSGYVVDKTKSYWTMTFIGYGLILAIPFLAYAGRWEIASMFIIMERLGKAVRSPARDAILSHATKEVGRGWGFGLHEALDQIGAFAGPMIFTTVFLLKGSYKTGFQILFIPAMLALVFLIIARLKVPAPQTLETGSKKYNLQDGLSKRFWSYTAFTFLSVGGFASFQLISYHLRTHNIVTDIEIPVFYAIAMGVDAVVALIIGKVYDNVGFSALIAVPLLSLPISFLGFSNNYAFAIIAVVLWGAVMGIHETIMRAAIADIAPIERRGLAYGIFNSAYGVSWFIGSSVMGVLYEFSISYVIGFAVIVELLSVGVFIYMRGTRI